MSRYRYKVILSGIVITALFFFLTSFQYPRYVRGFTGITVSGFSEGTGTVVSKNEDEYNQCSIVVKSLNGGGKDLSLSLTDEDCSAEINDEVQFIYESDNPHSGYLTKLPAHAYYIFLLMVLIWINVVSWFFLPARARGALLSISIVVLLLSYFMFSSQYPRYVKGFTGVTPSGFSDGTGSVVFKVEKESLCHLEVKSVTRDGKEQITEIDDEECSVEIYDEVNFIYRSDNMRHGYLAEAPSKAYQMIWTILFYVALILFLNYIPIRKIRKLTDKLKAKLKDESRF